MADISKGIPALSVCVTPKRNLRKKSNDKLNSLQWKLASKSSNKKIGTPCYPSPLDRIRCGKSRRAEAFGIRNEKRSSFELNQSFPRLTHPRLLRGEIDPDTPPIQKFTMDRIRGNGLHSYSFAPGHTRGSFNCTPESGHKPLSLSDSWSFVNCFGGSAANNCFPNTVLNPNKAVFTIDIKTSQILVVNDMACKLLGYTAEELCQMKLKDLFDKQKTQLEFSEEYLDASGEMVVFSGKVVEVLTKDEVVLPVSLWMRKFEKEQENQRCLAVMELVQRRVSQVLVDKDGVIVSADQSTTVIFQYDLDDLIGASIFSLIPALVIPEEGEIVEKNVYKQKATGRTKDGATFPLSLKLKEKLDDNEVESSNGNVLFSIAIWVFANMSGLLVLNEDGIVEACNHHFTHMMFGYPQRELLGQVITKIIPDIFEDVRYADDRMSIPAFGDIESELSPTIQSMEGFSNKMSSENMLDLPLKPLQEDLANSNSGCVSEITDSLNHLNLAFSESSKASNSSIQFPMSTVISSMQKPTSRQTGSESDAPNKENINPLYGKLNESAPQLNVQGNDDMLRSDASSKNLYSSNQPEDNVSGDSSALILCDGSVVASTPAFRGVGQVRKEKFCEGTYVGFGRHKDGTHLDIVYQVRKICLINGKIVYCIWVTRDSDDIEGGRNCCSITLASSLNSTVDNSLGQAIRSCAQQTTSLVGSASAEDDQMAGDYSQKYTTLQQIGKGAFGYVKMAYRNSDKLLVITKCIEKKKVYEESWVDDPTLEKRVPLEVSLLKTLKHPNIVEVLDVFENEKFFQMVMEKHGSGMDLFEFIDRNPKLDEPLISYIFRQIVSAVAHLHALNILHRDIKDENVIINERFHAKLIDFGSATFMNTGMHFSTFYGTVEYCSPEVLSGNKYEGPELEVWSLGVTLYIMTYGENPFFDVEETVKAELHPPFAVSEELMKLFSSMLAKNPRERCKVSDLLTNRWLNQSVDINQYKFEELVKCTPEEAHPAVYHIEDLENLRMQEVESRNSYHSATSSSVYSVTTVENFEDEEVDDEFKETEQDSESQESRDSSAAKTLPKEHGSMDDLPEALSNLNMDQEESNDSKASLDQKHENNTIEEVKADSNQSSRLDSNSSIDDDDDDTGRDDKYHTDPDTTTTSSCDTADKDDDDDDLDDSWDPDYYYEQDSFS